MKRIRTSITGNKVFSSENEVYNYLKDNNLLSNLNGMSISQFLFNERNKITAGKCVICSSATTFNEVTKKYNRFCSEHCVEVYKEQFKTRMRKTYGVDYYAQKIENQVNILSHRSISGKYNYNDSKIISFTASYEKDFLEVCEKILKLPSNDIMECPFVIKYKINNEEKFYIPDFYIPSIRLIVECKGSNNHYQKRDYETEKAKDLASNNLKTFNYIKILDKNYTPFIKKIKELANKDNNDETLIESTHKKPVSALQRNVYKKITREVKGSKNLIDNNNLLVEREKAIRKAKTIFNSHLRKINLKLKSTQPKKALMRQRAIEIFKKKLSRIDEKYNQ